eukprot:1189317-Prorocentrum_minimum.AAC.3
MQDHWLPQVPHKQFVDRLSVAREELRYFKSDGEAINGSTFWPSQWYAQLEDNVRIHLTNDARVAYFDRHISQNPLKTGRFKRVLEIGSGRAHFKILKFPVLEVQYVAYAGVTTLLPCRLHDGISLTPAPMHGQGTVCSRNR